MKEILASACSFRSKLGDTYTELQKVGLMWNLKMDSLVIKCMCIEDLGGILFRRSLGEKCLQQLEDFFKSYIRIILILSEIHSYPCKYC